MYAISHAASALLVRRRFPAVPLWPLLIAVQAIELLWVVLSLLGIEHSAVRGGKVQLDYLPWSHSIGSTVLIAAVAWVMFRGVAPRRQFATAIALAVLSHVMLDIVQHSHDIALLPMGDGPLLGLGLGAAPYLNLAVELAFGVACWWIFGGSRALLVGIAAFNLANLPTMLQPAAIVALVSAHRALLPLMILVQILATWAFVAWGARAPSIRARLA